MIRGGDGEFIHGPDNKELIGHTDSVNDIDFSADSAALVSGSSDGTIMIWDIATGKLIVSSLKVYDSTRKQSSF